MRHSLLSVDVIFDITKPYLQFFNSCPCCLLSFSNGTTMVSLQTRNDLMLKVNSYLPICMTGNIAQIHDWTTRYLDIY